MGCSGGVSNSPAGPGFQLKGTTKGRAFIAHIQNAVDMVLSGTSIFVSRNSEVTFNYSLVIRCGKMKSEARALFSLCRLAEGAGWQRVRSCGPYIKNLLFSFREFST